MGSPPLAEEARVEDGQPDRETDSDQQREPDLAQAAQRRGSREREEDGLGVEAAELLAAAGELALVLMPAAGPGEERKAREEGQLGCVHARDQQVQQAV